jgi:photosystem II stability/assembly factor-like uncharacterized protein
MKQYRLPFHSRFLLILCAFLLFLRVHPVFSAGAPQPPNWTVLFHDDFEDGNLEGWAITMMNDQEGSWQIETEGTNHVFAGRGFSTATLTLGRWYDYRLAARVKFSQSGIVFSFRQGLFSGYMVSFQADQMYLSRAVGNGMPSLVANAPGPFSADRWYNIDIIGIGANIKVYLDGSLLIDYTDADPYVNGGVAIAPISGGTVRVDDVELSGPPASPGPAWVKTGGPLGGVGYDVRMRPDNFDSLYVTDTFSGVNMSVDGGNTWSPANKGISARVGLSGDAIPVFCLTIDPHNPDIIWAGTQGTRGLFKSVDGGKTWIPKDKGVTEPFAATFRGFTVDPRTSDIVYAAGEYPGTTDPTQSYGLQFTYAKGMVYKSVDAGENWTAVWHGDAVARYIWIDPRNPDVLYVSTGFIDREPMNSDPKTMNPGGVGILKSTDGGRTWQVLNKANGLGNLYVTSLAMNPQSPDILLAGTGSLSYKFDDSSGVYLTADGGNHWQKTLTATARLPGVWDPISTVKFATANPLIAYAASQTTFWRSEDGGHTWRAMAGGPPALYYGPPGVFIGQSIDLQIDPRNPDRAFLDNYGGGVFLTEDGGKTWTDSSQGYSGTQMFDVKVDPSDPLHIYTIGQPGIYGSSDGGRSWDGLNGEVTANIPLITAAIDPANPLHVILTDDCCGRLVRTLDGGKHWTQIYQHPAFVNTSHPVNENDGFKAIAFAPSNPKVVYLGMRRSRFSVDTGYRGTSYGVLKSADSGETIQDANDSNTAQQDINTLAIDPSSESTVYVGTLFAGVFRTHDGGRSWQAVNQGLRLLDVRALAIDPANPSTLYAGIENGGVFKTVDAGANWSYAGYGMDPQAAVRSLAIDPTNPQTIYAADVRTGVYRSTDGAKSWTLINAGLRMRAVNVLAISTDGSILYAATDGEGIYRLGILPLFSHVPWGYWADYDGDRKTDVAAFHLSSDQFFTDYADNLGQFGWGGSDSMPLIWDYDGDGKTDVSIYHIPTNQWFVKGVGNLGQYGWGGEDSIPVPGDYNGDGRMERAFYHSPTNQWFVEGQDPVQFGWNGADCIPVPGDYDGDGKTDMVIYHIPSNQWFQYGVGELGQYGWGGEDSIPVPGDYNGDGKMEVAVYHIPTNQWFVKGIGNLGQYGWGGLESFPIPGDYNGDGVMERGFYRPSENRWFIEGESDFVWGWGGSEFMPITSQIAVYNWFRFMLGRFQ